MGPHAMPLDREVPDPPREARVPRSVATVVVTYNSASTISRCLRGIQESSQSSHVVVVDNASRDRTVEIVANEFPGIEIDRTGANLGFAAACNRGIRLAASRAPTHYLLVNPDAYLDVTCIEALGDALEARPDAAAASPLILYEDSGKIWYAGAAADVDAGIYWHEAVGADDTGQFTEISVTGRPTGCVMLVRRDVVDEVGLLDESYFLYWEDVEWGLRLQRGGRTVLFVPKARARHAVSSTTGGPASKIYEYYYLRNRLRLVHETAGLSKGHLVAANWQASARTVAGVLRDRGVHDGLSTGRAVVLAYLDFLRDRNGQRSRL